MALSKKISASVGCGFLAVGILFGGSSGANATQADPNVRDSIAAHFADSRSFDSEASLQKSDVASGATAAGLFAPSSIENIKIQEGVASPHVIKTCRVNTGAVSCSISEQATLTATISGEVSVGIKDINAALGTSYAESITQQWQCEGKPTGNTQLEMHPSGVFIQFEYVNRIMGVETSRNPGSAFIPTGIDCQIANLRDT